MMIKWFHLPSSVHNIVNLTRHEQVPLDTQPHKLLHDGLVYTGLFISRPVETGGGGGVGGSGLEGLQPPQIFAKFCFSILKKIMLVV